MLALAACLAVVAPARAEPVEDLRQALPIDDVLNPTAKNLKDRRERLEAAIKNLQTIGQLRRALVLDEWRDEPTRTSADQRIRDIDTDIRGKVGATLKARLAAQAKNGIVADRVAVANLIAEMGPNVRAIDPKDKTGFTRTLLPLVEKLAKDADLNVRQEALRAVGNINARPEDVARILGSVLKKDSPIGPRRLAADGLGQMVRVTTYLYKSSRDTAPVTAQRDEVLDAAAAAMQGSLMALQDADADVRKLGADAIQTAAVSLGDVIPELLPAEVDLARALPLAVKQLQPSLAALRKCFDALSPVLSDADATVRRTAARTLVEMASARQRFCLLVLRVPDLPPAQLQAQLDEDPLKAFLDKDLPGIDRLAASDDAELRKSATTFLLYAAAPMLADKHASALAKRVRVGLTDSERVTRFIAARSLGNMLRDAHAKAIDPRIIQGAVPELARMLADTNLWVRIAAAESLQAIGPAAKSAAEAVAAAAIHGDAEGRIAALRALNEFKLDKANTEVQKRVVIVLTESLGQSDMDAKALAAVAETLGQIGPAAKTAMPALRRLLNHQDASVRSAVTEAILAING